MDMLKNVALALGIVSVLAALGACNKNEAPPASSMSSSSSSSSGGSSSGSSNN